MKQEQGLEFLSALDIIEGLREGALDLVLTSSGDVVYALRGDPDYAYFRPPGMPIWVDHIALSRNAPNPEGAHHFLSYLLRPEVIATVSDIQYFPNCIPSSWPLVGEELRSDPAIYLTPQELEESPLALLPPNSANNYISQTVRRIAH